VRCAARADRLDEAESAVSDALAIAASTGIGVALHRARGSAIPLEARGELASPQSATRRPRRSRARPIAGRSRGLFARGDLAVAAGMTRGHRLAEHA
jgi:hypothetical protein